MSLMVDSTLHTLGERKSTAEEESGQAMAGEEHMASFMHLLSSSSVAFTLVWYYLLHAIKQRDRYCPL